MTATELIGKRITIFGTIATVTGAATVSLHGVETKDERICVVTDQHEATHLVFASVIEAMPETIRRDSFVYCP